ncbi:MAG: integrin alpha [Planctomycetota bacterium]
MLAIRVICVLLLGAVAASAQFPVLRDVWGPTSGGAFGNSVAGLGDVDGDGRPDFAVGAPYVLGTGVVGVYSGVDGTLIRFHSGAAPGDDYGWCVAAAGDIDGDGVGDLAVGSPNALGANGAAGRVEVRSGATGALVYALEGEAAGDRFGWSVDGAGDVDGDGSDDLIVGANYHAGSAGIQQGRAYVFTGSSGTLYRMYDGEAVSDLYGSAVSSAGDLDGDGRDEVVIGARWHDEPGFSNVGRAYVVDPFDDITTLTLQGEIGGDQFGLALDGGRDFDGDGVSDLLIGAMQNDYYGNGVPQANIGRAYAYSGATGALVHVFIGELAQDHLGAAVALTDDLNGDGCADIALGGLTYPLGPGTGLVRVHSGADGSLLFRRDGTQPLGFLGYSVSALGDADGDGVPEILIGNLFEQGPGTAAMAGRVQLLRAAGAREYVSISGNPPALGLSWDSAAHPQSVTSGDLRITGAAPFAPGVVAVSLYYNDFPVGGPGGFDVLIDIAPEHIALVDTVTYDAQGELSVPVNLTQAALDGLSLFVQAFETSGFAIASNGLEFRFTH